MNFCLYTRLIMNKEEEQKEEKPPLFQMSAPTMCMIVAIVLFALGLIVVWLWKMVPRKMSGGKGKGKWGARGGNCGCVAPP